MSNKISEDFELTKESLIEITEGGWLFFVKLFPELRTKRRSDRSCDNIINHFRGERKASLSCYKKGEKWMLYDHGDPDFSGDMFTIYKLLKEKNEI
ncbi:MAG: hypothetical protein ABGW97_09795 [Christiangramia sp.]|uniref:hypothetical protein n=1 Tax=Christiangramia sp. TaxID=1931228 RepID=UPI003241F555